VLVRQALVAAPAQHGTARPDPHGTSSWPCRQHEISVSTDAAPSGV